MVYETDPETVPHVLGRRSYEAPEVVSDSAVAILPEVVHSDNGQAEVVTSPLMADQATKPLKAEKVLTPEKGFIPTDTEKQKRKILGIPLLWFIILVIIIVLAVALGAGLGAGLNQKNTKNSSNNSDSSPTATTTSTGTSTSTASTSSATGVDSSGAYMTNTICIPDHNAINNPTFESDALGWTRSSNAINDQVIEACTWSNGTSVGVYIPAQNSSAVIVTSQGLLSQYLFLDEDTEYDVAMTYTAHLWSNATSSDEVAIYIDIWQTGNLLATQNDNSTASLKEGTTTSTLKFKTPASNGGFAVYFGAECSYADIYLHSITVTKSSDTSCSYSSKATEKVALDNLDFASLGATSDEFCTPSSNILSDTDFSTTAWTLTPTDSGSTTFLSFEYIDSSAAGGYLPMIYNRTQDTKAAAVQTFKSTSGDYELRLTLFVYQRMWPGVYDDDIANFNFSVTIGDQTLLDWQNTTIDDSMANTTTTLTLPVTLSSSDNHIKINALSTIADTYVRKVTLYEKSDTSCTDSDPNVIEGGSYFFAASNMSSMAVCLPDKNYVQSSTFEDLDDWSFVDFEGNSSSSYWSDNSNAGLYVTPISNLSNFLQFSQNLSLYGDATYYVRYTFQLSIEESSDVTYKLQFYVTDSDYSELSSVEPPSPIYIRKTYTFWDTFVSPSSGDVVIVMNVGTVNASVSMLAISVYDESDAMSCLSSNDTGFAIEGIYDNGKYY
ncbi:hypothetical protein V1511DRAFT_326822 [Dipodascopsis uninucleata]